MEKNNKISELNDTFRSTFIGGKVVMTDGIRSLGPQDQEAVISAVRSFSDFSEDNDPYGEHDFGAFDHNGQKVFWKIDYYDRSLMYGSEDPSDPKVTSRVLTVMLAGEY